jgi:hypothetical protein
MTRSEQLANHVLTLIRQTVDETHALIEEVAIDLPLTDDFLAVDVSTLELQALYTLTCQLLIDRVTLANALARIGRYLATVDIAARTDNTRVKKPPHIPDDGGGSPRGTGENV